MNIEEMKARKRELGYTYAMIAEKSGVPVGTLKLRDTKHCRQ